jgi:hypothetical protein
MKGTTDGGDVMRSIKSDPVSSGRHTSSDYTRSLRHLQVPPWFPARIFHGDPLVSVFLPLFKRSQINVPESIKFNAQARASSIRVIS